MGVPSTTRFVSGLPTFNTSLVNHSHARLRKSGLLGSNGAPMIGAPVFLRLPRSAAAAPVIYAVTAIAWVFFAQLPHRELSGTPK
jgi:hypothetical protein